MEYFTYINKECNGSIDTDRYLLHQRISKSINKWTIINGFK